MKLAGMKGTRAWRVATGALAGAVVLVALATPGGPREAAAQRPAGCLIEHFPAFLDPGPQTFELRERIPVAGGGEILGIAFGPPAGEYAKRFLFLLDRDGCERMALLVGSFGYLNDFARERGELGEGERLWHVELLSAEGQRPLALYWEPPDYDEMRALALEHLR